MRRAAALLATVVAAAVALPARAELPTRVELYTMGVGDDVFEAFGHSALCVIDDAQPRGVCYNYGTSDFSDPVTLIWDVLRGRSRFWVASLPLPLMLQAYTKDDRTIFRQKLDLSEEAARALGAALAENMRPENKYYVYHHYRDNCATRLRDHIDRATSGKLSRGADRGSGMTFRQLTQRGFTGDLALLVGMDILVGRRVDREATVWEAMFVPDVLRDEVTRRLGAAPERLYQRKGPVPTLSPLAGHRALWAAALLLTLLVVAGAVAPGTAGFRWALGLAGLVLGGIGLLVVVVAAVSLLPELRQNEVILIALPTDLLLAFLRGRALFAYLAVRLVLIAVVAVGLLTGLLIAPIWPVWALAAGPLTVGLLRARRGQVLARTELT